jgi:hypothetical protein
MWQSLVLQELAVAQVQAEQVVLQELAVAQEFREQEVMMVQIVEDGRLG